MAGSKEKLMARRRRGYKDFGILNAQEILCRIRMGGQKERERLRSIADDVCPELAFQLYFSILTGSSYEYMCQRKYIPLDRAAFYRYRQEIISKWAQGAQGEKK